MAVMSPTPDSAHSPSSKPFAFVCQNLQFSYANKTVLHIPTWQVAMGSRIFLRGASGSGKSTLLNLLCGMLVPTRGDLRVLERDMTLMSEHSRDRFRARHMGVVFQQFNLIPWLSVRDNLAFVLDGPSREKETLIQEWLERVGLGNNGKDYPYQMSIGMQQRAAVARAMIVRPDILFLDEPFSALDELTAMRMRTEVLELCAELGATVLLVTHNPMEAAYLADRLVIMAGQPGGIVDIMDLNHLGRPRDSDDVELWKISRQAVAKLDGSQAGS